jgi:uncharacterized membrane protein
MLKKIKKQFFAGLVIFVPLSLTIYFFHLLFLVMSQALLPAFEGWANLPQHYTRPISFVVTILIIWLLGVVASNFIGKRLITWFEGGIHHIPFFRGLYEALQKITEAFFGSKPIYQSAVLVEFPRKGVYAFAFVTNRIPAEVFQSPEPMLCVFVPTVPNPTSGFLLYIRESETIRLHMSIEETAKILVSHGFVPIQQKAIARKAPNV